MPDPVTVSLIVWNVISFLLHAYHIKQSSCSCQRWGLNCDCLTTPTEERSGGHKHKSRKK